MAILSSGTSIEKGTIKLLHKNEQYCEISAVLGIILLAGLTNDIIQYTLLEQPLLTTQSFTYIVLVFHVISVLMSVQAFIYTTLRYKRASDRLCTLLIVFNGLLLFLRVVMEMTLIDFRKEYYTS